MTLGKTEFTRKLLNVFNNLTTGQKWRGIRFVRGPVLASARGKRPYVRKKRSRPGRRRRRNLLFRSWFLTSCVERTHRQLQKSGLVPGIVAIATCAFLVDSVLVPILNRTTTGPTKGLSGANSTARLRRFHWFGFDGALAVRFLRDDSDSTRHSG